MNKTILIIIGIVCALLTAVGIMQYTYHSAHKKIHICYDIDVEPIVINDQTPEWLKRFFDIPKVFDLGEGLKVEVRRTPFEKLTYSSRIDMGSKVLFWEENTLDGTIYDVANDSWNTLPKANLSKRLSSSKHFSETNLLIWGGRTSNDEFLNDGVIYDIATLKYEKLPKPPIEGRLHPTIVNTGRKIIIFGGTKDKDYSTDRADQQGRGQQLCFSNDIKYDKSMYCNDGAIYDSETKQWQKLPECPIEGREYYDCVWHNSKLFILGGEWNEGTYPYKRTYLKDGAIYDATSNQWQKIPDYPGTGNRGYYTTIVKGSEIIVLNTDDNAIFDLDSNKWLIMTKCPSKSAFDTVELMQLNNQDVLFNWNNKEFRGAIYNFQTNEWKEISKCPLEPRIYYQYINKDSKLIIWAGHKDPDGTWSGHNAKLAPRKFFNDGAIYDFQTDKWTKMTESPLEVQDRYHPMNIFRGSKIFFCGGQKGLIRKCEKEEYYTDGAIYDLTANSWQKLASDISILQEPCIIKKWVDSKLIIVR